MDEKETVKEKLKKKLEGKDPLKEGEGVPKPGEDAAAETPAAEVKSKEELEKEEAEKVKKAEEEARQLNEEIENLNNDVYFRLKQLDLLAKINNNLIGLGELINDHLVSVGEQKEKDKQ